MFALFFALGINFCPLLGQNTGLALWAESAQLFIYFYITKKSLSSIVFPNQRCGCLQAKHIGSLVLLSTHICLSMTLLIQYRSLTHHYSRVSLGNLARCICMYTSACIYVCIYLYIYVNTCACMYVPISLHLYLPIFSPSFCFLR